MSENSNNVKWVVAVYPDGLSSFRVISISPDRQRSIHMGRLSREQADNFDGAAEWAAQNIKGVKGK